MRSNSTDNYRKYYPHNASLAHIADLSRAPEYYHMVAVLLLLLSLVVAASVTASTSTYDLLVIGSGAAGLTAAKFAAKYGKSVAIVERDRYGGDCTWTGCVPSKAILAAADAAHSVRTAAKYGIRQPGDAGAEATVAVDFPAVRARLRAIISQIYENDDSPEVLQKLGVQTFQGSARFLDPKTLEVTATGGSAASTDASAQAPQRLTARRGIVVATGARPRVPSIAGLEDVSHVTYEQIWDLESLPERLTVVGGGPIGVELGQAFARLGAKVTLVSRRLLRSLEPEVDGELARALAADGVELVRASAVAVEPIGATGGHRLRCSDGTIVSGDTLLTAVGRSPVVDGMGLEALGARLNERGGLQVDAQLRTSLKGVFAAGDCTGDQQYTHYAGSQGGFAATNALLLPAFAGVAKAPSAVPGCVFTSPEVARVGMNEAEARAALGDAKVAVAFRPMSSVDRAVAASADPSEVRGFIKIVYRSSSTAILGATIVGPSAGELASEIAVAMAGKVRACQRRGREGWGSVGWWGVGGIVGATAAAAGGAGQRRLD